MEAYLSYYLMDFRPRPAEWSDSAVHFSFTPFCPTTPYHHSTTWAFPLPSRHFIFEVQYLLALRTLECHSRPPPGKIYEISAQSACLFIGILRQLCHIILDNDRRILFSAETL